MVIRQRLSLVRTYSVGSTLTRSEEAGSDAMVDQATLMLAWKRLYKGSKIRRVCCSKRWWDGKLKTAGNSGYLTGSEEDMVTLKRAIRGGYAIGDNIRENRKRDRSLKTELMPRKKIAPQATKSQQQKQMTIADESEANKKAPFLFSDKRKCKTILFEFHPYK